ncbi:hypothetical protein B0H16DRAFT_1481881 [Mycena metata]|uniref:Uncharacterized protein n=1 Tax=Mycena metata TaxID=1033252 RepID=A0AAD7M978_9AGAR|nr:hypothetical protein B0H16DRAFT_1481881 [Mycena metata]
MMAEPDAGKLLTILAFLPDGLSDTSLLVLEPSVVPNVLRSRATLLRSSLAYLDPQRRLQILRPIRDHLQIFFPLDDHTVGLLSVHFDHFFDMVKGFTFHSRPGGDPYIATIAAEFGNICKLTFQALEPAGILSRPAMECLIGLMHFASITMAGGADLGDRFAGIFKELGNVQLLGQYFLGRAQLADMGRDALASQALHYFEQVKDSKGLVEAHHTLSQHYLGQGEFELAFNSANTALTIARKEGAQSLEALCLAQLALLYERHGNLHQSLLHAQKGWTLVEDTADVLLWVFIALQYISSSLALGHYPHYLAAHELAFIVSLKIPLPSGDVPIYRDILRIQADSHFLRSQYLSAREIYERLVLPLPHTTSWRAETRASHAWVLMRLAELTLEDGDPDAVGCILQDAQTFIDTPNIPQYTRSRFAVFHDILLAVVGHRRGEGPQTTEALLVECLSRPTAAHTAFPVSLVEAGLAVTICD